MPLSKTVTNSAFVVNMINTCIGVGLLAKPYALMIAGWYSIISVIMAFSLITLTAFLFAKVTIKAYNIKSNRAEYHNMIEIDSTKLLLDNSCDDEISENADHDDIVTTKSVFQLLGYKSLGKCGEYYVQIATMTILLLICMNLLIIEWQLLCGIITNSYNSENESIPIYLDNRYLFIYIVLFTLPIIFMINWQKLTFIGYISMISIITIVITIFVSFILCMTKFDGHSVPNHYFVEYENVNTANYAIKNMSIIERIFFSFIIFKSGICGTFAIPPLVISMKDKSWGNIRKLIFISYFIVTSICVMFGIFGFLIYNTNTSILILNNLFIWPSGSIVIIIASIKIINLWSSYGILLGIITFNLFEHIHDDNDQNKKRKQYLARFCILLLTSFVAYLFRNHLAFTIAVQSTISSLIGGATMLPFILYIAMFYHDMSYFARIVYIILFFSVISIGIIVLFGSTSLI